MWVSKLEEETGINFLVPQKINLAVINTGLNI